MDVAKIFKQEKDLLIAHNDAKAILNGYCDEEKKEIQFLIDKAYEYIKSHITEEEVINAIRKSLKDCIGKDTIVFTIKFLTNADSDLFENKSKYRFIPKYIINEAAKRFANDNNCQFVDCYCDEWEQSSYPRLCSYTHYGRTATFVFRAVYKENSENNFTINEMKGQRQRKIVSSYLNRRSIFTKNLLECSDYSLDKYVIEKDIKVYASFYIREQLQDNECKISEYNNISLERLLITGNQCKKTFAYTYTFDDKFYSLNVTISNDTGKCEINKNENIILKDINIYFNITDICKDKFLTRRIHLTLLDKDVIEENLGVFKKNDL
jgi:hypothetical protein